MNSADIVRTTLVIATHSVALCLLSEPRKGIRHPVLVWFLVFVVLDAVCLSLIIPAGLGVATSGICFVFLLLMYLILFPLLSSGPIFKSLFLFMAYVTFFMFSVTLAEIISRVFFAGSDWATIIIRTAISSVLFLVFALKLKASFLRATEGIEDGWGLLTVFALVASLSYSAMAISSVFVIESKVVLFFLFMVFSLLFAASAVVIVRSIILMNDRSRADQMLVQKKLLENELETEKSFVKSALKSREELRHHNHILLESLENGDIGKVKEFLRDYEVELSSSSLPSWCENNVVNAMLRIISRKCLAQDIAFKAEADIPDNLPLSGPEIVAVFGNLLENAYESCLAAGTPGSFIALSCRRRGNTLFVDISNTVSGKVLWENGSPVTAKNGHGIGMRSVSSVLSRYGGMLECKQKGNVFHSRVILPLLHDLTEEDAAVFFRH